MGDSVRVHSGGDIPLLAEDKDVVCFGRRVLPQPHRCVHASAAREWSEITLLVQLEFQAFVRHQGGGR